MHILILNTRGMLRTYRCFVWAFREWEASVGASSRWRQCSSRASILLRRPNPWSSRSPLPLCSALPWPSPPRPAAPPHLRAPKNGVPTRHTRESPPPGWPLQNTHTTLKKFHKRGPHLIGFKGVPEKIGEGRRGDGADFRGFRHERRGVAHTVLKLRHVNDDITERLAVATWITGDLQPTPSPLQPRPCR
jgi:hypothetical protein